MKFSFCGGLDCPDWLLAEIAAMASISAVKVKQISVKVTTLCYQFCLNPLTDVFTNKLIILQASSLILHPDTSSQLVAELCEETKLSAEVRMRIIIMMMPMMLMMIMMMMQTCSALLAAVCWILRGGAANSLDHGQLHAELLQLGTPR